MKSELPPLLRAWTVCVLLIVSALGVYGTSPNVAAAGQSWAVTATVIYVSPTGNDGNPGTRSRPIQTLEHARDLVRKLNRSMTADITVYLEDGVFRLSRSLTLGPQDSGFNGHTVRWVAAPGAEPVISGATRIDGWTLTDPTKDIWSAPVPAGLRSRQVFVNGDRALMTEGRVPTKLTQTRWGYTAATNVMAHWRNPSQIEFGYPFQLGQMSEPICPIASISGRRITMAEPCWNNSTLRMRYSTMKPYYNDNLVATGIIRIPGYVENAYELLTNPGQFYLDPTRRRLYYMPRPGQNMNSADVGVPVLQTLVGGQGSDRSPIHNLLFSGIQFSYATWLQPSTPEGFSEVQAGYTITGSKGVETQGLCRLATHGTCPYGAWTKEPGSVAFTYDRDVSLVNDRFVHLGAAALDLGDGSQEDTVNGSVFTDISGNGIELGGVDQPMATGGAQTLDDSIVDNYLHDLPVEYHGGVAILAGYVAGCAISHNRIDHVSYSGISIGWGGWLLKAGLPAVPNDSRDNVISDNLIYDYLQGLADGGAIYTMGITGSSMADGESVTGNLIHDRLGWGAGLKSDNGAAYVTYSDNAMYDDLYDWDSTHSEGPRTPSTFGPELVENNYWQQGLPDSSSAGTTLVGNSIIAGAGEVPASIRQSAGLQPGYRPILSWRPAGRDIPDPPLWVSVLEAYKGTALVTLNPSLDSAVTSYTVVPCRVATPVRHPGCSASPSSVTISAADLYRIGYVAVPGLEARGEYTFSAVANVPGGSSTPSEPSSPIWDPSTGPPAPPGRPTDLWTYAQSTSVSLGWYRPTPTAGSGPILGFRVTSPAGRVHDLPGRLQLTANGGGKMKAVVDGLRPGRTYTFSVAAVNSSGVGPVGDITVTTG